MFGKGITIGQLFGFRIRIDYSWFLIAALVAWTLARGSFPALIEQFGPMFGVPEGQTLPESTYWLMGILGSAGLFLSVVVHELSHALMARHFGLRMHGITLFVFGGVAEMADEPSSPKAEFAIAAVGPFTSFAVGFACLLASAVGTGLEAPVEASALLAYLGFLNFILALFNLVPAFPLDGGRILRSVLWQVQGDLQLATRITSAIGSGFGILLIALGAYALFHQDLYGIWYILLGLFVRQAAQGSYQQLLIRRSLQGETVSRFMKGDPVTVPRVISIQELVENYVYRYHHKLFPVVDGERLIGCVTTQQIRQLPKHEWAATTVGALAHDCSAQNSVPPGEDAMKALTLMSRNGMSRLLVVEDGTLLGILSLKDLLEFLSLKTRLEGR
jgi:Zn-dependent protease/CBS domain-containing protein